MIRFLAAADREDMELAFGGDLETLAAEAAGMLAAIYYRLMQEDPASAHSFAYIMRAITADEEDGVFSPDVLDVARAVEKEVSEHAEM